MDAKYDCESDDRQVGLSSRRALQGTAQGGQGCDNRHTNQTRPSLKNPNTESMLAERRRRWSNIDTVIGSIHELYPIINQWLLDEVCAISHSTYSALWRKTAVTAYYSSKQLPLFAFARQYITLWQEMTTRLQIDNDSMTHKVCRGLAIIRDCLLYYNLWYYINIWIDPLYRKSIITLKPKRFCKETVAFV